MAKTEEQYEANLEEVNFFIRGVSKALQKQDCASAYSRLLDAHYVMTRQTEGGELDNADEATYARLVKQPKNALNDTEDAFKAKCLRSASVEASPVAQRPWYKRAFGLRGAGDPYDEFYGPRPYSPSDFSHCVKKCMRPR